MQIYNCLLYTSDTGLIRNNYLNRRDIAIDVGIVTLIKLLMEYIGLEEIQNSNVPVSYTHLDVYKRQILGTFSSISSLRARAIKSEIKR